LGQSKKDELVKSCSMTLCGTGN